MKKWITCIASLFCAFVIKAQNVGVGTTNPQASLDVRGSQRVGGNNNYMQFDSATGRIEWVGAALYAPASQQIIRHSASSEGLYAGGGKLEYRNTSGAVFFTDWTNGNGYFSGNVGMGTTSPLAKIHVMDGASGVSPFSPSLIVAESNSFAYLSLLSPTAFESGVLFGNPTGNASGGIIYDNSSTPNGFQFRTGGNITNMVLDNAGRVGIGNAAPYSPLTFNNNLGEKLSLYGTGANNYGFGIQGALLQIHSDAVAADIAFGYGSSTAFTERMRIKGNGNVGIGTSTPNAPLAFPPSLGKKITLYPGATGDVGMAVQGNLFQIYSDNPNADIAFGYDQAGTMTERMRIKANGNVGIGNNNPQFPLDINGRARLSGTNPNDPGIWLNDASVDRAFIGLQNNTHVGFYGNGGVGWGFTMNTVTGALALNSNEGTAGQVLQSNGSSAVATWTSSTNTLYNNTGLVTSTSSITISSGTTFFQIPGMTYSFSTVGNAKVLVTYNVPVHAIGCTFCSTSNAYIDLMLDGVRQNRILNTVQNGTDMAISNSKVLFVGSGSHTVSLMGSTVGPDILFVPCCVFESVLNVQVIPQ